MILTSLQIAAMQPIVLSKAQARKIILNAAGLARKAQFGTGIEAVYRLIDHLGFVQLDTNYVVERAHHHVMAPAGGTGDVFILSPFDILNVFRHRLKDFFDFDYQIECFVPEAKRKYGYFSLPILAGDTFIAIMDAKADRKRKVLIVHNLHFEAIDLAQSTVDKLVKSLGTFARFNRCGEIVFRKSNNEAYLETIVERLSDGWVSGG